LRLSSFYLRFGERIDREVNASVHALAARLLENLPEGVTDIIPGYTTLYLEYDAGRTSERAVRRRIEALKEMRIRSTDKRLVEIPVRYDGEDLADVAARTGLSVAEVISRHSKPTYHVYALGFTPGYPFMGELDEPLRLPRRPAPRPLVPAHSVAIAGAQIGIYPLPSPGGWNLLGRALKAVYDPHREEPFLLRPGDEVRFIPAQGEPPEVVKRLELLPQEPSYPLLRVLEPGLLDLVMDQGRFLAGRYGLARGGPLDAHSAALASRLLGNPLEAPLLELNLKGPVLEALSKGVLAFAGWGMAPLVNGREIEPFYGFAVKAGDEISFRPRREGVRGYLAVASGIESGRFFGSASVDLKGQIGRPLRAGDVLGIKTPKRVRAGFSFSPYRRLAQPFLLRLLPGPQAGEEALRALCRHDFTVGQADRMGVHLEGAKVPGGDVVSEAVPIGAVQVTSGGRPIILLHDRGTLGGYQKPAVLHPADLPKAGQLKPGERLRFVPAPR
jgi:KipI family sensor histidine kinase inhibitor